MDYNYFIGRVVTNVCFSGVGKYIEGIVTFENEDSHLFHYRLSTPQERRINEEEHLLGARLMSHWANEYVLGKEVLDTSVDCEHKELFDPDDNHLLLHFTHHTYLSLPLEKPKEKS